MGHVNNLTITCIDYRFRSKYAAVIDNEQEGQSDLVVLAGASKAVNDEDTRESVLKQIDIAQRLHGIQTVHILDHIDCGAYGGSASFADDKDGETTMHKTELEKATQVIKERFPDLEVKSAIVDFDEVIR